MGIVTLLLAAAAIGPTNAPYWVKNRISRCYFGPIKRPPLNHDELMDDVDYYPEPYLARHLPEGLAVSFTLAAAGWGGRDDRRPGWIQLIDETKFEPLWPAVEHPDDKDHRLNLSPLRATIFGRLHYDPVR